MKAFGQSIHLIAHDLSHRRLDFARAKWFAENGILEAFGTGVTLR